MLAVVVACGLIWFFYYKDRYAYIEKEPVKQEELNFSNDRSEALYIKCVNEGNDAFKKFAKRGRVTKDNYPTLLEKAKKSCRCLATNHKMLKVQKKHAENDISVSEYNTVMINTARECVNKYK